MSDRAMWRIAIVGAVVAGLLYFGAIAYGTYLVLHPVDLESQPVSTLQAAAGSQPATPGSSAQLHNQIPRDVSPNVPAPKFGPGCAGAISELDCIARNDELSIAKDEHGQIKAYVPGGGLPPEEPNMRLYDARISFTDFHPEFLYESVEVTENAVAGDLIRAETLPDHHNANGRFRLESGAVQAGDVITPVSKDKVMVFPPVPDHRP